VIQWQKKSQLLRRIPTVAFVKNARNYILMLSLTNPTVVSNATDVVTDISPDYLSSLEDEVQAAADQLSVEVILLLIDRWESEVQQKIMDGKLSHEDARLHYVRLKISLHHLKRKYERDYDNQDYHMYSSNSGEYTTYGIQLLDRIRQLSNRAQEARKNFYVTKRRYQGEHRNGCTCRGCRCLKGIK
jgi:hypothetical protein